MFSKTFVCQPSPGQVCRSSLRNRPSQVQPRMYSNNRHQTKGCHRHTAQHTHTVTHTHTHTRTYTHTHTHTHTNAHTYTYTHTCSERSRLLSPHTVTVNVRFVRQAEVCKQGKLQWRALPDTYLTTDMDTFNSVNDVMTPESASNV